MLLCCYISFIPSAPGQPPQNVEWTLIGSQLTLQWDPVIALDTESEVIGYVVGVRIMHTFSEMIKTNINITITAILKFNNQHDIVLATRRATKP